MGLDLQYKSGQSSCFFRFSEADWSTIERLREALPAAVATCFDVPEIGKGIGVSAAALAEACGQLDVYLRQNQKLLPANYQSAYQYVLTPDHPVPLHYGTGGMGFSLVGDKDHYCFLRTGFNECRLERFRTTDRQKVEERDLRTEVPGIELQTVEWGKIRFRKSAAKGTLRNSLREIIRFAEGRLQDEITKTLG